MVAEAGPGDGYSGPEWSPDGTAVISERQTGLWVQPLDGASKPKWFLPSSARQPAFSPDGRFVVYSSNSAGRPEIWVRRFPYEDRAYRISRDGGWYPRWRSAEEISSRRTAR